MDDKINFMNAMRGVKFSTNEEFHQFILAMSNCLAINNYHVDQIYCIKVILVAFYTENETGRKNWVKWTTGEE